MRTACWITLFTVLNAAACGSRVVVGELGSGNAAGGASQGSGGSAGGAAPGGGVAETAGTAGQACAGTLNAAAATVVAACPDAAPDIGSPCDAQTENSVCVWQIPDSTGGASRAYRALGCYAGLQGKLWLGGDEQQSGPLDSIDSSCPKHAPALGAACPSVGNRVETCIYPADYCECSSIAPGKWLCTDQHGGKLSPPTQDERICVPAELDETQRVKDMGPKLTALWCQWLAQLTGKMVALSGKDSPGVADSYGYQTLSTPEFNVCLASLPPELCAQNLDSRGSECTATVGQLDDCVQTILALPNGGWVGHGCAPLLANPTCAGVTVQPFSGPTDMHLSDPASPASCVVPLQ
ncbi:MAG: hypothetical protein ABJB12_02260 [Pseudomonadota bacterium]